MTRSLMLTKGITDAGASKALAAIAAFFAAAAASAPDMGIFGLNGFGIAPSIMSPPAPAPPISTKSIMMTSMRFMAGEFCQK